MRSAPIHFVLFVASCGPVDPDGDGYGDPVDCAPEDPDVHPGAPEWCDGIDGDCDGVVPPGEAAAEPLDRAGTWPRPLEGVLTPDDAWATFTGEVSDTETIPDFGRYLRGPGDINGDGFDDVVIAADGYPAHAFFGPFCHGNLQAGDAEATFDGVPDWSWTQISSVLGDIGDLNQDGFGDVSVGRFIYLGPRGEGTHDGASADIVIAHTVEDGDVVAFGDANGDGFGDLAVSSPYAWVEASPEDDDPVGWGGGVVSIYEGPFTSGMTLGVETAAGWLEGEMPADMAGASVSGAGDLDGDGLDDLVVGAYQAAIGRGTVYAILAPFRGHRSLGESLASWEGADGIFGIGDSILGGADIDTDGLPEIIVGTRSVPTGVAGCVLEAPLPTGRHTLPEACIEVGVGGLILVPVFEAAHAGDLDGDGYPDVVVGEVGQENASTWFIVAGQPLASLATEPMIEWGPGLGADSPVAAGDTNSDGFDDVLVHGGDRPATLSTKLYLGN